MQVLDVNRADDRLPLVLLSGLAAGPSVFLPQTFKFSNVHVPKWPTPHRGDDLDQYASRIAAQLAADGISGPCIVGGASFGGILSHYLARHVDARAIVLIGSVRGPEELPVLAKCGRLFAWAVWLLPVELGQFATRPFLVRPIRRRMPFVSGLARQFVRCDARVFRWSLNALLTWRTRPEPGSRSESDNRDLPDNERRWLHCRVFHIHGSDDRVLPMRNTTPTRIVPGGGHVISLSHPVEVNAFLAEVMDQVESEFGDS